jgi:tetratricopeptide (TPR) repeat protein
MDARLQLNLGYSFDKLEQLDKAASAYETAAKLGHDNEVLFMANFNRGVLYQKEKKTAEALAAYQEALKYNESSVETKTNIEILTQEQEGKGEGKNKDKKDDKKDGKGDQSKDKDDKDDKKDDQDKKSDGDQEKDKEKPKEYKKNKPQPKPFKSEELTQGDVNKILGEIKQQEQKIRAEFNKKDVKEQGKDKDW